MKIHIGQVVAHGEKRSLDIEWNRALNETQKKGILELFQETLDQMEAVKGLSIDQIRKVDKSGVYLENDVLAMPPDLKKSWREFWGNLMTYAEELAPGLRDGNRNDTPYSSKKMHAEFQWTDEKRPELESTQKQLKSGQDTSNWSDERILAEAGILAAQALPGVPKSDSKFKETQKGIALSMVSRKWVYQATGTLKTATGEKQITAKEVWAHNSKYAKDGATASLDRTMTPVNLRQGEDGIDGSSNYYTGRVQDLAGAKEQAEFIFRSEMAKPNGVRKGITWDQANQTYVCTFAVQSLLATGAGEKDLYDRAHKAYEALKGTTLTIDGITVKFNPIGPASTSINQFWADREHRIKVNKTFIQDCRALITDPVNQVAAIQAINDLENYQQRNRFTNDNWEEIMLRAYVCYLLEIPEVIHCKSSKDRTGFIVACVAAMIQYIKYVNGGILPRDILAIAKTDEFKELFKMNLILGVKMTQIGNLQQGYKIDLSGGIRGIRSINTVLPDAQEREKFLTERGLISGRKRNKPNLGITLVKKSLSVPQQAGGPRIKISKTVLPDVPFVRYILQGKENSYENVLNAAKELLLSLDNMSPDYDKQVGTIMLNLRIATDAKEELFRRKNLNVDKIESRFSKFKIEIMDQIN